MYSNKCTPLHAHTAIPSYQVRLRPSPPNPAHLAIAGAVERHRCARHRRRRRAARVRHPCHHAASQERARKLQVCLGHDEGVPGPLAVLQGLRQQRRARRAVNGECLDASNRAGVALDGLPWFGGEGGVAIADKNSQGAATNPGVCILPQPHPTARLASPAAAATPDPSPRRPHAVRRPRPGSLAVPSLAGGTLSS
jgi:hypothetical protein